MIIINNDEMNEILIKYMSLNYDEVDQYLEELGKKYNCVLLTIMNKIKNQAKLLGDKEYSDYLKRHEEIKINRYSYVKMVKQLIFDMENNVKTEFKSYGSINDLLISIKKYLLLFPKDKEKVEKLILNINKYHESLSNSNIKYSKKEYFILINNTCDSQYVYEIKSILNCSIDEEAISRLRKYHYTENEWNLMLERFAHRYKNANDYIPRLQYLYNKYKETFGLNKIQDCSFIKEQLEINKEQFNQAIAVVNELLIADCSIEEFCYMNPNYDIKDIEKYIRISVFFNPGKANIIKKYLNNKDKTKLYEKIKNIVFEIETNKDFDIVDYYYLTKLSTKDFMAIIQEMNIDVANIRTFFNIFNSRIRQSEVVFKFSEEYESKIVRTINGSIVDNDTKKAAFEFLRKNSIPVNMITYKLTLKKYLNHKIEELTSKKYLK